MAELAGVSRWPSHLFARRSHILTVRSCIHPAQSTVLALQCILYQLSARPHLGSVLMRFAQCALQSTSLQASDALSYTSSSDASAVEVDLCSQASRQRVKFKASLCAGTPGQAGQASGAMACPTSLEERNRSVLGDRQSPVTRSVWPVKYLMYLLSCSVWYLMP